MIPNVWSIQYGPFSMVLTVWSNLRRPFIVIRGLLTADNVENGLKRISRWDILNQSGKEFTQCKKLVSNFWESQSGGRWLFKTCDKWLTFRVIAKVFDSKLFGRKLSRKKKLSFLSLRLLYRVNCNPGMILTFGIWSSKWLTSSVSCAKSIKSSSFWWNYSRFGKTTIEWKPNQDGFQVL